MLLMSFKKDVIKRLAEQVNEEDVYDAIMLLEPFIDALDRADDIGEMIDGIVPEDLYSLAVTSITLEMLLMKAGYYKKYLKQRSKVLLDIIEMDSVSADKDRGTPDNNCQCSGCGNCSNRIKSDNFDDFFGNLDSNNDFGNDETDNNEWGSIPDFGDYADGYEDDYFEEADTDDYRDDYFNGEDDDLDEDDAYYEDDYFEETDNDTNFDNLDDFDAGYTYPDSVIDNMNNDTLNSTDRLEKALDNAVASADRLNIALDDLLDSKTEVTPEKKSKKKKKSKKSKKKDNNSNKTVATDETKDNTDVSDKSDGSEFVVGANVDILGLNGVENGVKTAPIEKPVGQFNGDPFASLENDLSSFSRTSDDSLDGDDIDKITLEDGDTNED